MSSCHSRRAFAHLILALPVLAGLGCSGLSLQPPDTPPEAALAQGKVVVEVRPEGKKPKVMEMSLTGPTHVQDAVEASRQLKKFRRMNVDVYRATPEGRRIRLQCDYDISQKRIKLENDYALQPGDYVVITEDTTNAIDDMFRNISGPLQAMMR